MGFIRGKLTVVLIVLEILFIILFALFVEYDPSAGAEYSNRTMYGKEMPDMTQVSHLYPMFQDVHVMMFIGFGYLMTFLKRYGFGSVGFNMLVAAFVLQWATLMQGFMHLGSHHGKIIINMERMITADFAAAVVLITMGALLGKVTHLQLIVIALIEIVLATVNEWICVDFFQMADVGGSMVVHVFGAYFGLAMAWILRPKNLHRWAETKEGSVYHSDLFAMIGTVFLWLFWPSFNSALAVGAGQHRAVLNTYYSLAACTIVSFAFSAVLNKRNKVDMVHIQNATLAGGVAVGTVANMMIQPWGALLIGAVAGILSTLGYKYITPALDSRLKLHDTCGVNNLHGMPGLMAGIAGVICAALASVDVYGDVGLKNVFGARGDRSAALQAGYQAAALFTSLGVALVGGVITGLLMKIPIWDQPKEEELFDDASYWELPEAGFPEVYNTTPEVIEIKRVERGEDSNL